MPSLPSETSRAAHLGGTFGIAAAVLVMLGVGGATLQFLPPFGGFLLMVLGLVLALVGLVTSIVGMVATTRNNDLAGRNAAMRGLLLCMMTIIALAVPASRGLGLPRINDITTDPGDPPVFVTAAQFEANLESGMTYPGASFAEQQQEAYPDLASLVLEEEPAVAFDRVRNALAAMPRMLITAEEREEGRLEATETSALFHFADDVVVRIRPFEGGGSRIDVRSRSRVGKGDLGVNAARIRDLFVRVRGTAVGH